MKDTGLLLELPVAAGAGWINEGLAGVGAARRCIVSLPLQSNRFEACADQTIVKDTVRR